MKEGFKPWAYSCSGSEKQTHCGNLQDEIETHKSCGEKPPLEGCSEKGRAAHISCHEHCTSHKWGRWNETRSQFQLVGWGHNFTSLHVYKLDLVGWGHEVWSMPRCGYRHEEGQETCIWEGCDGKCVTRPGYTLGPSF